MPSTFAPSNALRVGCAQILGTQARWMSIAVETTVASKVSRCPQFSGITTTGALAAVRMTPMAPDATDLAATLGRDPRGWTVAELEHRWSRAALRAAVAAGSVARVARGIYAATEHASSFAVRAHVAHLVCGPRSVVIGPAAAAFHGLCDMPEDVVVAAPHGLKVAHPDWLTVRRMRAQVPSLMAGHVPIAIPPWAAVTAYALVSPARRDSVIYRVVQSRLAQAADLFEVASAMPRLRGRRHFEAVFGAAVQGSESHLETVGLRQVFNTKDFADFLRQHRVRTPAGNMRLDMYHPASRTAVELDGAGTHGKPEARLSDMRRDAELARVGIFTLRLSSVDVFRHKEWCRQVVLETVAARM